MNRIILQIFFAVILLCNVVDVAYGQKIEQIGPDEKVVLFCDRNLYITGEQIYFSGCLQSSDLSVNGLSGRVLYCELITPDGDKIAGNKYLIDNSTTSGFLTIPKEIITGIYYLRAYTKFMRNWGPSNYQYTAIKIINPYRNDVQLSKDNNYVSGIQYDEVNPENRESSFKISTDKSRYTSHDTVHLSIADTALSKSAWNLLSISVSPEFSISKNILKLNRNLTSGEKINYYPESHGVSITGKLTDNSTGNPLPNTRVNLSIIGKGRDFMAMKTDAAGRFFFYLPDYTGYRDIFICAENIINTDPKILVDNDFCTIPVHIPADVFTLTRQEREAAYNMAVNVQLESYYKKDSVPVERDDQRETQVFYGKPTEILSLDNFVQLPSLAEYFNELPTLVKVRKRKGEYYFKVFGTQTELSEYDPLVLVDLVAVDDPTKVLAIPPSGVSRIDIVNRLYVKGDLTYGGIINIITKRGDFAGIDLPSSGIFINYCFLANGHYQEISSSSKHLPDTRNTLYWNPQFVLNNNNTAQVSFTTSDTEGRYFVVLNGVDRKGEIFRKTFEFEVFK